MYFYIKVVLHYLPFGSFAFAQKSSMALKVFNVKISRWYGSLLTKNSF